MLHRKLKIHYMHLASHMTKKGNTGGPLGPRGSRLPMEKDCSAPFTRGHETRLMLSDVKSRKGLCSTSKLPGEHP